MTKKQLNRYIKLAYRLFAERREFHSNRTFHVTFILSKGKIVSTGINRDTSHPRILKYKYISKEGVDFRSNIGVHSELDSLIRLKEKNTSKYDFLNIRLDKQGNVCYSKPCHGCQHALNQFGYKNFFYTETGNILKRLR